MVSLAALLIAGCASPFAHPTDAELRRSVEAGIQRELAALPSDADHPLTIEHVTGEAERRLAPRRAELDAMSPAPPEEPRLLPLAPPAPRMETPDVDPLSERPAEAVFLTLDEAVHSAVKRNLAVQVGRLQPAITEADVIAAEAAFDLIIFSEAEAARTRRPQTVPIIMGVPVGAGILASDRLRFETGVRQPLMQTGGEIFASGELLRARNRSPDVEISPDPAYTAAVNLGIVQPLLRDFGEPVATATIRLARNIERRALEEHRAELLDVITRTEEAYWNLHFAWRDLEIQQWLLDEGRRVRDILERRLDVDVREAEYSDAVATVEQRRANVILARRQLHAASDALKAILNDPELAVGSELLVAPADLPEPRPMTIALRDAVSTALNNRPEVEQALSLIDDALIRRLLAENALLPRLDLGAQISTIGLDERAGSAAREAAEVRFLNAIVGVGFEMPWGNRAAIAGVRQARLQRTATVLGHQQVVQNVILEVKEALRDVRANAEMIAASRSFRIAQAENLRALEVRQELVGFTPEFLNLMFTRQNTLALARQQEVQSMVAFDQSVAALHRAMGASLKVRGIDIELATPPRLAETAESRFESNRR